MAHGEGKADETTPLVTLPADISEDDKPTKQLRERATVSYTTIALVSALLAGVSFLAYATPPSVIFDSAGGSAAAAALAPQPAVAHKHKHEPTGEQVKHFLISARNVTYEVLFDVYGIVIPLAFALNLLGTLSSSGVILFVNSLQATPAVMHKLFGDKTNEHTIMRYPAFFLVGGVGSLFVGFACGICLYYGLLVASLIALFVLSGIAFYECYWARGHGDTYNALNLSLASLFFRSCMPDLAKVTDEHPHLNPPPLAKDVEKGETTPSKKHEAAEL